MREAFRFKTWAGPLTIGSFVVVGASGILMFFHLNIGLVKLAHEWLGWLLVLGGLAHLVVNWKPFLAYFRKPAGIGIIAVLVVLGLVSLGASGKPSPRRQFMAMSSALEKAPLSLVVQVAKTTPEAAADHLKTHGIQVRNSDQTISEIASDNKTPSMEILSHVFDSEGAPGRGR